MIVGDDGDVLGKEEDGEVVGLLQGEHGGLHLVLVDGGVVIEGGRAEAGGGGTADVEFALGDAGEVDVFGTSKLVHGEEREVWFPVYAPVLDVANTEMPLYVTPCLPT